MSCQSALQLSTEAGAGQLAGPALAGCHSTQQLHAHCHCRRSCSLGQGRQVSHRTDLGPQPRGHLQTELSSREPNSLYQAWSEAAAAGLQDCSTAATRCLCESRHLASHSVDRLNTHLHPSCYQHRCTGCQALCACLAAGLLHCHLHHCLQDLCQEAGRLTLLSTLALLPVQRSYLQVRSLCVSL